MSAYDVESGDQLHPGDPVTVDRYTTSARINHWITAISLVLLAQFSGGAPNSTYVPAHVENGKLVPGVEK